MYKNNSVAFFIAGLLAVGCLTWATPALSADSPNVWKATGSMATSRRYASRDTLPDGRILVVGGSDTTGVNGAASVFHATAELYDPVAGTWSATGSLTTGRALHTSTNLPNGKILIVGGRNTSTTVTNTAEIYDPATGTFSVTGAMATARADHKDATLFDGRILITGGFDNAGNPIASAEIYNPTTGTFTATTGPMATARSGHRSNPAGAGKTLVVGGFGAGGTPLASAELFDPAVGTFSAAASLAQARGHHFSTALPTGEILLTGGFGAGGVLNTTELYDPDTNTWAAGGTLNQARQSHGAFLLPNGLVLIASGNNSTSSGPDIQTNFLSSAELYNRQTNTFTSTGSSINAAGGGSSIVLWTGRLLRAGGGTNAAELYTPEMLGTPETWVATGSLPSPRSSHQQNLLDDGRVLLSGGLDSPSDGSITPTGNALKSAVLYDYLRGTFTATGDMTIERQSHRTATLYTGKVLVTGGRSGTIAAPVNLNSAELFDPATGTFTLTGTMTTFRRAHRATELRNGKVLISGGRGGAAVGNNGILASAQLYDPATGAFTPTGSLVTGRTTHQEILLYTGKVLVAGGTGAAGVLASAELYDPTTGTFAATGSMITARNSPTLTRLPDGKVLVSGGTDAGGVPIQTLEIYDPATVVFSAAGNAPISRDGRVTRLDNGKLMFVSGVTSADPSSVTSQVDLYNHVGGTFSATGRLITGRDSIGLTSLPNGRILVTGGVIDGTSASLTSAELYTPLIGDAISVDINNVNVTEGNSGTVNAVFTVSLSASSIQTITVNFSMAQGTATAGSDYVAQSDVLTFNPGETSKNIAVVVNGDNQFEANETFFVNLANATNAIIADSQGMGTINNDDIAEKLSNISTRGAVLTGDNVMIGGFIIAGSAPKRVLIRSRGPSMSGAPFFVPGTLANPLLRLFSGSTVIAQNDNWQDAPSCPGFVCEGAPAITATGLDPCTPNPGQPGPPPGCTLESAILITLSPSDYTGIVSGADGGTGVGIVEVFEADASPLSELSNISTRGFVQTGANVMIGGLIIEGTAPKSVLIRARGPSMSGAPFNLSGTLANPTIDLYSGSTVIAFNDNWRSLQQEEIIATGLDPCQPNPGQAVAPPGCDQESAMVLDMPAGGYTAIVSGVGGTTGIGLVEIFEVADVTIPNALGNYMGSAIVTLSNCQNPINNGTNNFFSVVNVSSQNGSIISGAGTLSGPVSVNLNLSGTATAGADAMGSFTFTQPGASGSGTFTGSATGNTMTLNFTGQFTSGESCAVNGSSTGNR